MKKHHRLFSLASALLLALAALPCTALAAETEGKQPVVFLHGKTSSFLNVGILVHRRQSAVPALQNSRRQSHSR